MKYHDSGYNRTLVQDPYEDFVSLLKHKKVEVMIV